MSHLLYSTRLYWAGTRGGFAKLHGKLVILKTPPQINGQPVVSIDYIPEIAMRQIQQVGCRREDMDDDEVAQADALLAVVAGAVAGVMRERSC